MNEIEIFSWFVLIGLGATLLGFLSFIILTIIYIKDAIKLYIERKDSND